MKKITILKASFKNLKRRPFRSLCIVLSTALAASLILSAYVVSDSIGRSLESGIKKLGADIIVVPKGGELKSRKILLSGEAKSFYMEYANIDKIKGIEGVDKVSPQLYMASTVMQCCSMPTVLLVGYDPETDFTINPWIAREHKVRASEDQFDRIILGASALGASEGTKVTFFGKTFVISKSLHPTGLGFLDFAIFMDMDAALDMIVVSKTKSFKPLDVDPNSISSALVSVRQGTDAEAVSKAIESGMPGVKAIATKGLIASVKGELRSALAGFMAAGIAAWAMAVLLSGVVFAMSVNERQGEFGLMRALGATRMQVARSVLAESVALSAAGGVFGAGIAVFAMQLIKKHALSAVEDIHFAWPSVWTLASIAAICIALIALAGAISALYPAFRAANKEPYDAVRQGKH